MADELRIGSTGVDYAKWKKLTPKEIIKEEGNGEEIPSEIIAWAQQMVAFSKIPDDITYEKVDGDVGLDALEKLGIEDEKLNPEIENAQAPIEPEEPDAVKDPALTEKTDEDDAQFVTSDQAADVAFNDKKSVEEQAKEDVTLADSTLTTDADKIIKRKERKGLA